MKSGTGLAGCCCCNWCGISLFDVVKKFLARIMKEILELISESILPESQCGFRKGCGCVDMILLLDNS